MTSEELEREFASKAARANGGTLIFSAADAINLIQRARECAITVLGIDGFQTYGDYLHPLLDHILDCSRAVREGDGCWDEAIAFIEQRLHSEMSFDVVLGKRLPPN